MSEVNILQLNNITLCVGKYRWTVFLFVHLFLPSSQIAWFVCLNNYNLGNYLKNKNKTISSTNMSIIFITLYKIEINCKPSAEDKPSLHYAEAQRVCNEITL